MVDDLVTRHSAVAGYVGNAKAYRAIFEEEIPMGVLEMIRVARVKRLPIGSSRFIARIEEASGLPVMPMKRGPRGKHQAQRIEANTGSSELLF